MMKPIETLKNIYLGSFVICLLSLSHRADAQFSTCAPSDAVCVGKILLKEIRASSGSENPVSVTGAAVFRDWGTFLKLSHVRSGQVAETRLTTGNVEPNSADILSKRIAVIKQSELVLAICENHGGSTFLIEASSNTVSIKRLTEFMFESAEKCLNWMNDINSN